MNDKMKEKLASPEIQALIRKKKQARHNFNRQRAKEVARQDVRVSSSFWMNVERDYINQIYRLLST
jgi:hypothetical protein